MNLIKSKISVWLMGLAMKLCRWGFTYDYLEKASDYEKENQHYWRG